MNMTMILPTEFFPTSTAKFGMPNSTRTAIWNFSPSSMITTRTTIFIGYSRLTPLMSKSPSLKDTICKIPYIWILHFTLSKITFRKNLYCRLTISNPQRTEEIIAFTVSRLKNIFIDCIINCRANRLIDYALQQARIPMISTAGFAGESSWEWCFDGLSQWKAHVTNPQHLLKYSTSLERDAK